MTRIQVKCDVDRSRIWITAPFALKETMVHEVLATWHVRQLKYSMPATPGSAAKLVEVFKWKKDTVQLLFDAGCNELLKRQKEQDSSRGFKLMDGETLPEIPGVRCHCEVPLPGDIEAGQNPLYCMMCDHPLGSMGHQRKAYWFGKDREALALIMGMGTGKSKVIQAICDTLDADMIMSALILAPRRAVPVWPDQFAEHSERDWTVIAAPLRATVAKRSAFVAKQIGIAEALGKPYAVVVNHEAAWRPPMNLYLENTPFQAMVIDESHKIKSPGGRCSKWCAKMTSRVDKRIIATGTFMPHGPMDAFAQMRFLDPGVFGTNFHKHRNRYCVMGGYENRQIVEYVRMDEHDRKWGEYAFICGEEVLDLPPVRHLGADDGYWCELEPAARKAYKEIDKDYITYIKQHPEDDGSVVVGDNALTKLLRLQQISSGWVKDDEGQMIQISTAKEKLLEETMDDLAVDEPLIVCCRFRHDLETVKQICIKQKRKYGEISGRVNETSPEYGLSGSRMRDDVDVVAVQIQAGGVGIDLTRAAYCILYSVGYSLGDYEQFLKRTHRPGQVRPVTYIHLICKNTKDEAVYEALLERRNLVAACNERARKA